MTKFTHLVQLSEAGKKRAAKDILPLVYDELRKLAGAYVTREAAGLSLQATDLVHAAYLRLVKSENDRAQWANQAHFFSAAAQAMRRILIEKARRRRRDQERGLVRRPLTVTVSMGKANEPLDLLALDEALTKLEGQYPVQASIVQMRFFAGLTHEEIAKVLGLAAITVKRHWRFSRVWLHRQLNIQDR